MADLTAAGILATGPLPLTESEKVRACANAVRASSADSSHLGLRRPWARYSPTSVSRFHFSRESNSFCPSAARASAADGASEPAEGNAEQHSSAAAEKDCTP